MAVRAITNRVDDVVVRLWKANPDLSTAWEQYRGSSDYKADQPYNSLAELAHRLVDGRSAGMSTELKPVFLELEDALSGADQRDRNLLIVGFIEDLQNISMNRGVPLRDWDRWLGPITREAWSQVEKLWSGEITPAEFNQYVDGPEKEAP